MYSSENKGADPNVGFLMMRLIMILLKYCVPKCTYKKNLPELSHILSTRSSESVFLNEYLKKTAAAFWKKNFIIRAMS